MHPAAMLSRVRAVSDAHDHSVGLPEIHDEAGDTPLWVPVLGLALLVLATLYMVFSAAFADEEAAEAPTEAAAVEAPAEPAEPAAQ